jgi:outer membrane receptor protein involved in Fe transport
MGRHGKLVSAAALAIGLSGTVMAQPVPHYRFDIQAQDLKFALRSVTRQAGLQLFAGADDLRGRKAPELHSDTTVEAALQALLAGTGLHAEIDGKAVFIRGRAESETVDNPGDKAPADIVVTGSRIRGAKPTSPVIAATREEIEDQGFTDLGSYARSIPQNFSGGQNPGVVSSNQSGSENFNSASTINLRGLGPDATLTLLNGHRLAYNATDQGIDISQIPLEAIDRVEVVADGASALYGSDAVAGVANIILRRDYQGFDTGAQFGAATDGGDTQQQYDLVTGRRWGTGGFMVAGRFSRSTAIVAHERSYTRALQDSFALLPSQRQISGVVAGHQQLQDNLEFEIDGQIDNHRSRAAQPFSTDGDARFDGVVSTPDVLSYSVSPGLKLHLPGDWLVSARGTVGDSDSRALARIAVGGAPAFRNKVRYDDGLGTGELNAEGPLFRLPGGAARLAVGAGARVATLDASIVQVTPTSRSAVLDYSDKETVAYGYGELALPFVSAQNARSGLREFEISAAVRYEHYNAFGSVTAPKFGLRYSPFEGMTLKASWGRSFKAPTFSQADTIRSADLLPASFFFPAPPDNRDILLLGGGNGQLKPERATTWTGTIDLSPLSLPGVTVEISRFDVRYRDRVVQPLAFFASAFTPGLYPDLIAENPGPASVAAALSDLPLGLNNETDHAFDPGNVGAIVDDSFQNAARQHVAGFDVLANYTVTTGRGHFSLQGRASYLTNDQTLSADQPTIERAGTIFNPPHWRAELTADWTRGVVGLNATFNYIGGNRDNRTSNVIYVGDFKTLDLTARIKPRTSGVLGGLDVTLAVQNALNGKPPIIRNGGGNDLPYDATNYSSIGRFVSLTIAKAW